MNFEQTVLRLNAERKAIKQKVKAKFKDATEVYIDFDSQSHNAFKYLVLYRILIEDHIENAVFMAWHDPILKPTLEEDLDMHRQVCDDTVLAEFKRKHGDFDESQISPM